MNCLLKSLYSKGKAVSEKHIEQDYTSKHSKVSLQINNFKKFTELGKCI